MNRDAGGHAGRFAARVLDVVRRIPPGRVATYGDVAGFAGRPRAARPRAAAGEPSGFVFEEIAENLLAQNKGDEARPWFAKAWEALSKEAWLVKSAPERIARIRELSHQSD